MDNLSNSLIRWLSRRTSNRGMNAPIFGHVSLSTDIGLRRAENQDRVACLRFSSSAAIDNSFFVVAVADGMGGMNNGAECAVRAIAGLFSGLIRNKNRPEIERLKEAANEANQSVFEYSKGNGGATLSALLVTKLYGSFSLNVGDSRIYATNGDGTGRLSRLTVDDSLAEAVGGHGRELLQFIGMGPSLNAHVNFVGREYDKFLLTTDGVHFINNGTLEAVLANTQDPSQAASRLSTLVRWHGAPDNASLAVFSLEGIHDVLCESPGPIIEVSDSFGDLQLVWIKHDLKSAEHSPFSLEGRSQRVVDNASKNEELGLPEDAAPIRPKKVRQKRKAKASSKEKANIEGLQIVIEMESVSKDGSNDTPK